MKVLFDQGVPIPLRKSIPFEISTCYEMGWSELSNGDLLNQAEALFDIFVTTDKNIRYQQHIAERTIAIFVLPTTRWPLLKDHAEQIGEAIASVRQADYIEWIFPSTD